MRNKIEKFASINPLHEKVVSIINDRVADYDNNYKSLLTDILTHGCVSGVIGELIYYVDTHAFYDQYKAYISTILHDMLQEFGTSNPAEIFGKNWSNDDPLILDENKNLLAWFGFEETCRNLAYELGYNI